MLDLNADSIIFKAHATNRVGGYILLLLVCSFSTMQVQAEHVLSSANDSQYRDGLKVYSEYCSRCHGTHADGRGRSTPLYVKMKAAHPSNFQLKLYSYRPKQYLANIVRDGGEKHSMSKYMPPFGDELTTAQISDVVYFIQKVSIYSDQTSMQDLTQTQKEK